MSSPARPLLVLAALSAAMAVAAGAFGAHAAGGEAAKSWLQTGGHYQLIHALAVFAAVFVAERAGDTGGDGRTARIAAWLFLAGGLVFAGSLYLMAAGGPRVLGAITPLGGLALIGGWLTLAFAAFRVRA